MENWIDPIIKFMLVSSAFILILGSVSFLLVHILKIRGKARLWICTIVLLMPIVYPFQSLLPEHVRFPVPLENLQSFYSTPIGSGDELISNDQMPEGGTEAASNVRLSNIKVRNSNIEISSSDALMPVYKISLPYSLNWKQTITIFWIAMFFFILVRFVLIIKKISLLRKCADNVTDPCILKLLRQCATETGLMKMPRLMKVERMVSPVAVGFLHPAIIIPERLLKPEFNEGLRFALLHELKHLQRLDNWWLLIESLINAAYFFHPVIYWAKHRIHEEWEYLCDNHVIQVTNKPASYADFLLHEIWRQSHGINPSVAKPFISSRPKTARRVHSILEKKVPNAFTKIREQTAISIIFISFIFLFLFNVTPSAHVKESDTDIYQVPSVEGPDVNYIPAKFDISEKSTTVSGDNMSFSVFPSKKSDEPAEIIDSPLRNNPEPYNISYAALSEGSLKAYDAKTATKDEVKTSSGNQTLSKNENPSYAAGIDIIALQENTDIDRTDIQPAVSKTPVKQDEFNSQRSFETASLDIDRKNEPAQQGDGYSVIIQDDLTAFNEHGKDETTASSNVEDIPEKYNLDDQLERLHAARCYLPRNFDVIDKQSFILEGYSDDYYLIILKYPSNFLPMTTSISIDATDLSLGFSRFRPDDRVIGYYNGGSQIHLIDRIYKLNNMDDARTIKAQILGEKDIKTIRDKKGQTEEPSESIKVPKGARIYNYQVIDDRNVIIMTYFYGNFKATLTEGSPKFSAKEIIGIEAQWPYELDENSSILLSNGNKCRIEKLVPYIKKDAALRWWDVF